jgi:hypothetical protein
MLEGTLGDEDPAICYIAVEALRDMQRYGREIGSCFHALAGMVRNEKEESLNRIAAAIAILGIRDSAAIPRVSNLLPAESPTDSFIAAVEGGGASPEDVQTVRDALDGGSREVRSQGLQVLSDIERVILVENEISNRSKGNPRSERP